MNAIDNFLLEQMSHEEIVNKWISTGKDYTYLLDHDLTENSIVIEFGGYLGDWSTNIYEKYKCNLFIYEPVKKNYDEISQKFSSIDKIKVLNHGVSDETKECEIIVKDDSSSVYQEMTKSNQTETISLKSVSDIFNEIKSNEVDLISMNIEGCEYGVMESLIESGLIKNVKKLQVQFHFEMGPETFGRRSEIQKKLMETHTMIYNYDFCWEAWQRK
jgi:FkbM family methyltransferase